jgi:Glyoxalase-like domain
MLRMRQICLVAHDLDAVEEDLTEIFGIAVCYRDPAIRRLGLHNILMPIGNNFLEVVSPVEEGTTAERYLDRRGGDGGYMVIAQTDDLQKARKRIDALGIRLVSEPGTGHNVGFQMHPKDVPGGIQEIRQNEGGEDPAGPWWPAGGEWKHGQRTEVLSAMVAAEIQTDDPKALAARWGDVFDREVSDQDGTLTIAMDDATIRFVPVADGRGEGLGGLDLAVKNRDHILATANRRGCRVDGGIVIVCGMRFRLL